MFNDLVLPEKFQSLLDSGVSGIDIIHGFLKNLMYETEGKLEKFDYSTHEEYDDTVTRLQLEGYQEALGDLYNLTVAISFYEPKEK